MIYRENTGIDNFKIGTRTSVLLRNGFKYPSGLKTQVAFGTSKNINKGSFTGYRRSGTGSGTINKFKKKMSMREEIRD